MDNIIVKIKSLKNLIPISEFIGTNNKLSHIDLKNTLNTDNAPGVYVFWLPEGLNTKKFHLDVDLKGVGYEKIIWEKYKAQDSKNQCLYVGKTTNFTNRISAHLSLGRTNWYKGNFDDNTLSKPTSMCQLRAGIEHLLKHEQNENNIDFIKDNVLISFVEVTDIATRFYLENYAIGYYRPWFNIDVER